MTYSRLQRRNGCRGIFTSHFRLWGCCQDFSQCNYFAPSVFLEIPMHTIYNLPNELILHIVSYIKDRSTLPSLSLVSITFNRISTASLYHIYRNRESEETNALLDGPSLQSFLRLILMNPGLASLVKRVDLGLWQTLFDVKSLDFYHALLAGLLPLKI